MINNTARRPCTSNMQRPSMSALPKSAHGFRMHNAQSKLSAHETNNRTQIGQKFNSSSTFRKKHSNLKPNPASDLFGYNSGSPGSAMNITSANRQMSSSSINGTRASTRHKINHIVIENPNQTNLIWQGQVVHLSQKNFQRPQTTQR